MAPATEDGTGIVLRLFEKFIDKRKEFAADAIGEEAVVADVTEIMVRDMRDKTGQEFADGQRYGLKGVGIMVKIFEDDGSAVVRFKA